MNGLLRLHEFFFIVHDGRAVRLPDKYCAVSWEMSSTRPCAIGVRQALSFSACWRVARLVLLLLLHTFFFFRLLEYLQAMRHYFLLEAGDTMYDFYTAIFDKVREKEIWQQPSFLNGQLQEAVGQRRPEDSSRYCMSVPVFVRMDSVINRQLSSFERLSIFLETIDPGRKKHPVNNVEVLTLSYKVGFYYTWSTPFLIFLFFFPSS